jgi:hypothetical protein
MSNYASGTAWLDPAPGPLPESLPHDERRLAEVVELYPDLHPERALGAASGPEGASASAPAPRREHPQGALTGRARRHSRRGLVAGTALAWRWLAGRAAGQAGMATAEYAIATLGAVAFAGLLVVIMRSDEVRGFLLGIIRAALALP